MMSITDLLRWYGDTCVLLQDERSKPQVERQDHHWLTREKRLTELATRKATLEMFFEAIIEKEKKGEKDA